MPSSSTSPMAKQTAPSSTVNEPTCSGASVRSQAVASLPAIQRSGMQSRSASTRAKGGAPPSCALVILMGSWKTIELGPGSVGPGIIQSRIASASFPCSVYVVLWARPLPEDSRSRKVARARSASSILPARRHASCMLFQAPRIVGSS